MLHAEKMQKIIVISCINVYVYQVGTYMQLFWMMVIANVALCEHWSVVSLCQVLRPILYKWNFTPFCLWFHLYIAGSSQIPLESLQVGTNTLSFSLFALTSGIQRHFTFKYVSFIQLSQLIVIDRSINHESFKTHLRQWPLPLVALNAYIN